MGKNNVVHAIAVRENYIYYLSGYYKFLENGKIEKGTFFYILQKIVLIIFIFAC